MNKTNEGHLFIISGPSGVGKDTIIKGILQEFPDFELVKSYTTRLKRKSDEVGNRVFVSEDEFKKMVNDNKLIEWTKFCNHYYGRRKEDILKPLEQGKNIIIEVDVVGTVEYKKKIPGLTSIFIKYENPDKLLRRIKKNRPETIEDELNTRKETMNKELKYEKYYNYSIVNLEGHPEKAIKAVAKIIQDVIR